MQAFAPVNDIDPAPLFRLLVVVSILPILSATGENRAYFGFQDQA